ncbi:hypothetical protein [Methanobrevibacter sp.]|uniref:hypothetical protein n=1 Tax=Methanobrevibacter sp. TaxID=66852 RepID=UPI0026DF1DAD|nr:hypothetical protein [Methanobrevibacter sp.]MDO5859965.1 hypothetical protein [Methanobrevibacter sp.]
MNKKIIIILAILCLCFLLASPASAKEKSKVKISADDGFSIFGGYIEIKLVDSHGKDISSKGTIHYKITDENGYYKWAYKPYGKIVRLRYDPGTYNVEVKFDGDSHYKPAKSTKTITISQGLSFDAYTYYDNHNWGLNQRIDDYIEDNYWDEEIYDDASTYDGEGP